MKPAKLRRPDKSALRRLFLGNNEKNGLVAVLLYFLILAGIGFIYLYPILYMIVGSFLSPEDLVDPAVSWIPTSVYFGNFVKAWNTLHFLPSFLSSVVMTAAPAALQCLCTACIGYGLARFEFPLKKLWMALVIATFIIPGPVTLVPRYVMYYTYGFIDTPLPSFIPALLGQGLRSAIFILIFWQFFRSYPKALDEAAEIDGAGRLKVFWRIAMPMASSAIVLCLLFSFVWYWNETAQSGLYFGKVIQTLPMRLNNFAASYQSMYNKTNLTTTSRLNESISLAGTFLSILPMLLLYLFLQKQFVESIERSGIAGE